MTHTKSFSEPCSHTKHFVIFPCSVFVPDELDLWFGRLSAAPKILAYRLGSINSYHNNALRNPAVAFTRTRYQ